MYKMKKRGWLFFVLVFCINFVGAAVLDVPGTYSTIQDAVDAASSGDTIQVAAGTYNENIVINNKQDLVIQGTNAIIEPSSGMGFVITDSENITIKNLAINTTGINAHGIWVGGTPNGYGNSNNIVIENNVINVGGESTGIYVEQVNAPHSSWIITGNTINAPNSGVDLELYDVDDVLVDNNIFGQSGSVSLVYSSENSNVGTATISNNEFMGNGNIAGVTPTIWIESDFIFGDGGSEVDGVTINNNKFSNWINYAIRIGEGTPNYNNVSNVMINNNIFNHDVDQDIIQDNAASTSGTGNIFNVQLPAKIQQAIDNAFSGDTINVSAGTYNENVILNKTLNLIGSPGNSPGPGPNAPILDGRGAVGSAITITVGISNISIQGFEIRNYTNSGSSGGVGSGILAWNSVGTSNIRVLDNYFHDLGWSAVLVGNEGQSLNDNWLIKDNIVSNVAFYSIELTNTKNSRVIGNTVTGGIGVTYTPSLTETSDDGILIQSQIHTGSGLNVDNITVSNNTINGTFERAGIEILAWVSTDSLTSELDDINIINNNISGAERGIYLYSIIFSFTDPQPIGASADIDNLDITDNTINRNDDGIQIRSFGGGTHGSINIERNDIINSVGTNSGIHIRSGTLTNGIKVHFNSIVNNSMNGINNEGDGTLNATHNWWGSCDGPGVVGPGHGDNVSANVIYDPWIGICITNKTNVTCAFESENITLEADLAGVGMQNSWISYIINGINYNKTAAIIGNKIQAVIPSNELIGGKNVIWNVYVNDSFNRTYNNSWKTFYVRERTYLEVLPWPFDGSNGWFITEPEFSLISDPSVINSYYEWDSIGEILYTGPFGLENIPNAPPKESAGTLKLNWWSEFTCGNESKQNQTFYIDLVNPLITPLHPIGTVYNDYRPTISAYLDEVYQSNSGIDIELVSMSLDGNPVPAEITPADDLDAIISYTPTADLPIGQHSVTINATDNAGRESGLSWKFTINLTAAFNLTVHSPLNWSLYNSKRVRFNITTTKEVEKIEYINWIERRPRWKRLCRRCDEYGFSRKKTKTLKEGWNNITIRATGEFGNVEANITLFIDSKKPRISRTRPRRNSVINGSEFYIKYTEDNLQEIILFWNPNKTLENCTSGRNQECITSANLSDFDGQWIKYWFEVSDQINTEESRKTRVFVDTTLPVLTVSSPVNGADHTSRKVPFNLTVSEDVTLEYRDNSARKPRWRRLCSRCDGYGDEKRIRTKSFKKGHHDIEIRATDKAGNSDIKELSFDIDY